jgi:hypothetical protein
MGEFVFCLGRKKPVGVDVWLRVNQSVAYGRVIIARARRSLARSFPRLQIRHCISEEVQVKPRLNAYAFLSQLLASNVPGSDV